MTNKLQYFNLILSSIIFLTLVACGGGKGGGDEPEDLVPPVITITGDNPLQVAINTTFIDPGATAIDNVDGSVSVTSSGSVDTSTIGSYDITYTSSDSSGNTSTIIRVVNVISPEDTVGPIITITGANPLQVAINTTFIDPGATAIDNVDGSVPVISSGSVDTSTIGSYDITYTSSDNSGNTSTAIRIVNVIFPRVANTTCVPGEEVSSPAATTIEASFPDLPALASPLAMVQPESDSSFWLMALRSGRVVHIVNDPSADQLTEVLDIRSQVTTVFEMGLTGLVIHPNYPSDNRVFVVYNDINQGGRSTLSSFSINVTNFVIDPNSEMVLLTLDQPADNHNGGDLAFGSDGMLYASFGDGGADRNQSQNLSNLLGSVIRIDVSTTPYSIPTDNPFFNSGLSACASGERSAGDTSNCPEIYAYGFRNPWRFSFDQQNGDLWVADVGQSTFEEVDRVISGGNYGWPIMEANSCFNASSCDMQGLQLPITQYPRSVGVSTVGGYVYRGTQSPSLIGNYIWGDTFSSQFLSIPANSGTGSNFETRFNSQRVIAAMAQGNDGEIYLLNFDGDAGDGIYKIVDNGSMPIASMPVNLSETGCFNTQTKNSASGVFDYDINSILWSDGALKKRSFALSDSEQIELLTDGDFDFPTDSILIKHFLNGSTYIETRLLVNHENGWAGYSYEWNDAQTDAVLLMEGKQKDVGDFIHTFPSSSECFLCHSNAANTSLGIEISQLNKFDDVNDVNYLDRLSDSNYFTTMIDSEAQIQLFSLGDNNATLNQRARSYLHSNCSGCHRPDAAAGFIDLRFSTSLQDANLCSIAPTEGDLGVPNARRISLGNADASVLFLRMQALDSNRMPPLASLIEDTQATSLIRDWINSLNSCDN